MAGLRKLCDFNFYTARQAYNYIKFICKFMLSKAVNSKLLKYIAYKYV